MLSRFFASALLAACSSTALIAQSSWQFTCDSSSSHANHLTAESVYPLRGTAPDVPAYGFDLKTAPSIFASKACSGNTPFFFSLAARDGNYEVTIDLGAGDETHTTVRAESRRLMLQPTTIAAGKARQVRFIVNVRTPEIYPRDNPSADPHDLPEVKLKPREIGALDWDNKLTLEFNGSHPGFRSISIRRVEHVPTLYLAGDSTVVDQDKEPWAAWGQILPVFFNDKVSIANNAESGETIRSFVGERRLAKVMSVIQPGDYLFIQFAHNDQKPGKGFVSISDYKALMERYIQQAHDHGATVILVTSMNRRRFDASGHIEQTLGDYPQATREVAAEQKLALIDLNAISKTLFEAMGEQGTLKAFVHYPAHTFPGQDEELKDDTHFNSYGAYELARCIVQSIHDQKLPLARFLKKRIPHFDPAHPDPVSTWIWPLSPLVATEKPYER